MTVDDILDQATAMLQRRGRLAYRTLKRQFGLDDTSLDDLTYELIEDHTARACYAALAIQGHVEEGIARMYGGRPVRVKQRSPCPNEENAWRHQHAALRKDQRCLPTHFVFHRVRTPWRFGGRKPGNDVARSNILPLGRPTRRHDQPFPDV